MKCDKFTKNSIKLSSKVLPQDNSEQSEITLFETSYMNNDPVINLYYMIAKRNQ